MAGATDRSEAVAATVETRSYLADEHHTRPHLGEDTDVARAQAGLDANETLNLLADLVVAEVRFWKKAGLGINREVLVDVVAESPAEAVYGPAKALEVDPGVEHAHLGLIRVGSGLRLRFGLRRR